jgi:dihydrofolate reductase
MVTQYFVASSLDGFIATEDDDLDWLTTLDDGGDGSDHANPYEAFLADVGAIAMGATTYEWVLRHLNGPWPYEQPTWVFTSRQLRQAEGGGPIHLTAAPVPEVHALMVDEARGRNVWLVGGGELVGQFLDHDLLDELWLTFAPVLLRSGKPLLPRRRSTPLSLLATTPSTNGTFVHLRYALRAPE